MLKSNAKCFVNDHGQIVNILEVFSTDYIEGSVDVDGNTIHSWDEGLNVSSPLEASQNYYWDNDTSSWETRESNPSPYHIWLNKAWTLDRVRFEGEIRRIRNDLLSESDWTQTVEDAPLTEEMKAEWATYRQELRDITDALDGIQSLGDVPWPNTPA